MPFDPTKPVMTRGGRKARIICTDRAQDGYPIVAGVGDAEEDLVSYRADGRKIASPDNPLDLINIPEPPKLRPWKPEEVPLNGLFRHKESRNIYKPSGFVSGQVRWSGYEQDGLSSKILFENYEWSVDGATWHPCGILE